MYILEQINPYKSEEIKICVLRNKTQLSYKVRYKSHSNSSVVFIYKF